MDTPPFEMGTCGGATGLGIKVEYCIPLGAVLEHCKIKQSSQKYVTCIENKTEHVQTSKTRVEIINQQDKIVFSYFTI